MMQSTIRGPYKVPTAHLFDPLEEEHENDSLVYVEMNDLFEPQPIRDRRAREVPGQEGFKHDMDLLRLEWAIKYPTMRPHQWLSGVKGYTKAQTYRIIRESGGVVRWRSELSGILDTHLEVTVRDLLADLRPIITTLILAANRGIELALALLGSDTLNSKELLDLLKVIEICQSIHKQCLLGEKPLSGKA